MERDGGRPERCSQIATCPFAHNHHIPRPPLLVARRPPSYSSRHMHVPWFLRHCVYATPQHCRSAPRRLDGQSVQTERTGPEPFNDRCFQPSQNTFLRQTAVPAGHERIRRLSGATKAAHSRHARSLDHPPHCESTAASICRLARLRYLRPFGLR